MDAPSLSSSCRGHRDPGRRRSDARTTSTKHRFGGDVVGSSSGFDSTEIASRRRRRDAHTRSTAQEAPGHRVADVRRRAGAPARRRRPSCGRRSGSTGLAERSRSSSSRLRSPSGTSTTRLSRRNFIALSTHTGEAAVDRPRGPLRGGVARGEHAHRGTVFETFLNRHPVGRACKNPGNGLLLAIGAGPLHTIRWQRNLGASETSPLVVGNRLYIGTARVTSTASRADDREDDLAVPRRRCRSRARIAYDRGKVFFGAYNGNLYALGADRGKLMWTASSAVDFSGGHGTFYSTPAVAYSRVYIGSTDGKVYAFDERTGRLAWAHATGGYVYGSPAVYGGHVFIGSYDHNFYAPQRGDREGRLDVHVRTDRSPARRQSSRGVVYFANLGAYARDDVRARPARPASKVWSWQRRRLRADSDATARSSTSAAGGGSTRSARASAPEPRTASRACAGARCRAAAPIPAATRAGDTPVLRQRRLEAVRVRAVVERPVRAAILVLVHRLEEVVVVGRVERLRRSSASRTPSSRGTSRGSRARRDSPRMLSTVGRPT